MGMIVITTMDALPDCCYECPCNNGEHSRCEADKDRRATYEYRPYWCPLKEVSSEGEVELLTEQEKREKIYSYALDALVRAAEGGNKMKYNIKVGEKYLIGENMNETLKGTVTGDTTAVYSRFVGEMSAYDFCETADEASCFDRITACDYIRGIMERQNYGFYLGDIKVFDADHEETIVHCKNEENAKIIARILDMDEKDTFLVEEGIWGKVALNEPPKEEEHEN